MNKLSPSQYNLSVSHCLAATAAVAVTTTAAAPTAAATGVVDRLTVVH
jgi:hypothetical protein